MAVSKPSQSGPILPAARSPFSPQKFFEPLPPPTKGAVLPDDSDNWWAGVQNCFASIAISAALLTGAQTAQAIAIVNLPQDDPAGNLSVCPNEDYWQLAVPAAITQPQQPFSQQDEIETVAVVFEPDEDYWLVTPRPAPAQTPQQPWYEQQETIPKLDEDYWQFLIPQPVAAVPQVFSDDSLIVPQPVVFEPDEDYWWLASRPSVQWFWTVGLANFDEVIVPQPAVNVQNYVSPGTHNYVSQEIGTGIEF